MNLLLRKKGELSSNSTDDFEGKRPLEAPSFDDSIAKAANNGVWRKKVFEKALKSFFFCDFMQLYEKFGIKNEWIVSITPSAKDSQIKG